MNALVGYDSSDEDENEPRKPVKIAKMAANEATGVTTAFEAPKPRTDTLPNQAQHTASLDPPGEQIPGPAWGPAAPILNADTTESDPTTPPLSPYTSQRLRVRELTMPTHPNFDIPSSPPQPSSPDSVAALAATTKKFERFLELKRKGVHFNARLQTSSSLRNPSLLPKLMDFAGISKEDSYRSTLDEETGGVPVKWGEGSYVESLAKENDRWRKRRAKEREKVDFVPGKNVS